MLELLFFAFHLKKTLQFWICHSCASRHLDRFFTGNPAPRCLHLSMSSPGFKGGYRGCFYHLPCPQSRGFWRSVRAVASVRQGGQMPPSPKFWTRSNFLYIKILRNIFYNILNLLMIAIQNKKKILSTNHVDQYKFIILWKIGRCTCLLVLLFMVWKRESEATRLVPVNLYINKFFSSKFFSKKFRFFLALKLTEENLPFRFLAGAGFWKAWTDWKNSRRSEERRVGKECRSRWSPYH